MSSHQPLLSIGLPVFNGQNYLRKAIRALLGQTLADFEIVLCDNASTDGTAAICREFIAQDRRIRYYRNDKNLGAARNFNLAFRNARGKYFAWAAHDDLFSPTYYEKCVAYLEANPGTVLCCAKTAFIDENGNPLDKRFSYLDIFAGTKIQRFQNLVASNPIMVEIFGVFRSEYLAKTNLIADYDSSDIVLLGEMILRGEFHCLPETLFFHREHRERSVRAHASPKERLAWFNPAIRSKLVFPRWRRFVEHLKSIIRAPGGFRGKLSLGLVVIKAAFWSRKALIEEIKENSRLLRSH